MNPSQNPQNKQYEDWGVEPPSHEPHGTEAQLAEVMAQPVKHGNWVQMGNIIECRACPNPHSDRIGVEYLLTGTDEKGLPVLTKIAKTS